MKEGWKVKNLGDLYSLNIGKTPDRGDITLWDEKKVSNNLWVSISDISANEGNYITDTKEYISNKACDKFMIVPEGALLLSFKLSLGKMSFAGKALRTNEAILSLLPISEINHRFLYYYFLFFDWEEAVKGDEKVKGKTLNKKKLSKIPILYPPLSEQQRIVSILDAEFAKIDSLKTNAERNLQNAKDLFQSALKKELEPKKGWSKVLLSSICSKIGAGATPLGGKNTYCKEGVSLIRSLNVHNNTFCYKDLAHINDTQAQLLSNVEIYENDVLFNITGASVSRCCVVPKDVIPARVNQHVSILRVIPNSILPSLLVYTLISPKHKTALMKEAENSATRQSITKKNLEEWEIDYPKSVIEQQSIVSRLDILNDKCNTLQLNYEKTIALCEDLKQAILRKAFNGEI